MKELSRRGEFGSASIATTGAEPYWAKHDIGTVQRRNRR